MRSAAVLYETGGDVLTLSGPPGLRRKKDLLRLSPLHRGAILADAGRIRATGGRTELRRKFPRARRVDLGDTLVVPGLVDAHTHLPFLGSRAFELDLKLSGKSYLQILAAGGGIHRTVRDTRRGSVSSIAAACDRRLDAMLAHGTTTVEAKSGYGLSWPHERKQLLALRQVARRHAVRIVPTFLGAHVVPKGVGRAAYVGDILHRMLPAVAKGGFARFCDVFADKGAFTVAEAHRILRVAKSLGLGLKLHADEFVDTGAAAAGASLGCTSVDHLLHVSIDGARALARSRTAAVLLPLAARSAFEGHQAPARPMIEAGVAPALGTDFNPNNHNLSMLEAIRAAIYDCRLRPVEALSAATLNAAHAVGMGNEIGSLEVGKRADFVALGASDLDDVVYRQGENVVEAVAISGKIVRRAG